MLQYTRHIAIIYDIHLFLHFWTIHFDYIIQIKLVVYVIFIAQCIYESCHILFCLTYSTKHQTLWPKIFKIVNITNKLEKIYVSLKIYQDFFPVKK